MINKLGPLLALEPAPRPVADADRLWIVDGTLVPVRDRTVAASARPAPGDKADAHAWRESDLPAAATGTTVIADGAYLGTGLIVPHRMGTGLIVPHRRRAGRPLLRGQDLTLTG